MGDDQGSPVPLSAPPPELMSLNMLIETPGGADYTAAECAEWMGEAGFKTTRAEHLAGPESMGIK
jgi:hypothetical protein